MGLSGSELRRRIQFRRVTLVPDGYGGFDGTWADYGSAVAARRTDVSDSERMIAGGWDNKLVTRFVVRANGFTRGIRRTDRIVHDGITFEIDGIKEVAPHGTFLEITAQSDGVA